MAESTVIRPPLQSPILPLRRILSTRVSWIVLAVVVIGLLSFGSVHNGTKSSTQRINELENVIKCPPCADISIAQSDDLQAKTLRVSVVKWVNEGWSDTKIENTVVALYGPNELLRPHTSGVDILVWAIPLVALVFGGGGIGFALFRRKKKTVSTGDTESDELLVAMARDGSAPR